MTPLKQCIYIYVTDDKIETVLVNDVITMIQDPKNSLTVDDVVIIKSPCVIVVEK